MLSSFTFSPANMPWLVSVTLAMLVFSQRSKVPGPQVLPFESTVLAKSTPLIERKFM